MDLADFSFCPKPADYVCYLGRFVSGKGPLEAIAAARPRSRADLATIAGVGPTKLLRYADDLLAVVASARATADAG